MIGFGGGAEEALRARVRCAWGKFRELAPIVTLRGASLTVKGKVYKLANEGAGYMLSGESREDDDQMDV